MKQEYIIIAMEGIQFTKTSLVVESFAEAERVFLNAKGIQLMNGDMGGYGIDGLGGRSVRILSIRLEDAPI